MAGLRSPSPNGQRPTKPTPAILLVVNRLHAHGYHQVVKRNSPPCLTVQVVEGVLPGLGFGQEFPAATALTPRPPNCFNRYNRANTVPLPS